MSPEERLRDSILLKERWSLIQSGISRRDIKIRKSHLYVKNKLYGQYKNSVFVHSLHPSSPEGSSPEQPPIVPSNVSHKPQSSESPTITPSIVPSNLSDSSALPTPSTPNCVHQSLSTSSCNSVKNTGSQSSD